MRFLSEVYWDKGGRCVNQDSISLQEVRMKGEKVVFALICDGIGGLDGGEIASGFVAERMTEWFYKEALNLLRRHKGRKKIEKSGLRVLYGCNGEMVRLGRKSGMKLGTTVTAMLFAGRRYFLWHSGDTRAYRVSMGRNGSGKMKQLTQDHTLNAHTLLRCIGSFEWKMPQARSGYWIRKATVLLCSDGFRNKVEEEKIMQAMLPELLCGQEQIYKHLKEMAEYVKGHGEMDNISAIAVRMG